MASNPTTPPARQFETDGLRNEKRFPADKDKAQAPAAPKTAGASADSGDTAKSPVADRNLGTRQAGITPRPTDKPIVGGDRSG